jgi:hypothetical protein
MEGTWTSYAATLGRMWCFTIPLFMAFVSILMPTGPFQRWQHGCLVFPQRDQEALKYYNLDNWLTLNRARLVDSCTYEPSTESLPCSHILERGCGAEVLDNVAASSAPILCCPYHIFSVKMNVGL